MGPDFHRDWGGVVRKEWPVMFADLGWVGKPGMEFLEIGCFEGRTTLWLLENVLTDPSSRITVIDTFEGSPEFVSLDIPPDFKDRFLGNVAAHRDRVKVQEAKSQEILPTLTDEFDFVFIDGSHKADDVWQDAILVWPLLKSGGVLVFDDYLWGDGSSDTPRPAVDRFLVEYADELTIYRHDYHCAVVKL